MATTTNFGWETPDDTDLVKDGAAAMRTLGNSIDTSFVDLKGGTTGQILSKASNTDLDYTWTSPNPGDITEVAAGTGISGGGTSGAVTITNSMATAIDAKGDLIAGTGADAFSRLAVGTNGQVLQADSTTATGLKWASAGATKNYTLINAGGTALTGATTITYSGLSGYDSYLIQFSPAIIAGSSNNITLRLNGDSASNYAISGFAYESPTSYSAGNMSFATSRFTTSYILAIQGSTTSSETGVAVQISGANTSGVKVISAASGVSNGASATNQRGYITNGYWNNSATITSISILSSGGNFTQGTMWIYGAA